MIDATVSVLTLAVVVTCLVLICRTLERISHEWSEAWRYYTRGRAGLLAEMEEEIQQEAQSDAMRGADALFEEWHSVCQWNSEEQAAYVRRLWKTAFRADAPARDRSEALRELRDLGAPIPSHAQ